MQEVPGSLGEEEAAREVEERKERELKIKIAQDEMALESMKVTDAREKKMIEELPPEERVAALAFVRWSAGRKFTGGPVAKMAAKGAWIEAFKIAQELYRSKKEVKVEKKKSSLILPGQL